jgi:hypothetical protein
MLEHSWTFFIGLVQTSNPRDLERHLETQPDLRNIDIIAPIKFKDQIQVLKANLEDEFLKKSLTDSTGSQVQPEAAENIPDPGLIALDNKSDEEHDQESILPKELAEKVQDIKEPLGQGYDSAFASQAISSSSSAMSLIDQSPEKVQIFGYSKPRTHSRSQSAQLYVSQLSSTMTSGAASELNLNERSEECLQTETLQQRFDLTDADRNFADRLNEAMSAHPQAEKGSETEKNDQQ